MPRARALPGRWRLRADPRVLASAASRRRSSAFAFAVLAQPLDMPFGRKQVIATIGSVQTRRVVTMQPAFEQYLGDGDVLEAGPACPVEPIHGFGKAKVFGERTDP